MRLHIMLDDDLVAELDRESRSKGADAFIAQALRSALEDQWRWDRIESTLGSISDDGHAWDDDPAAWVREQRRGDERRVG